MYQRFIFFWLQGLGLTGDSGCQALRFEELQLRVEGVRMRDFGLGLRV